MITEESEYSAEAIANLSNVPDKKSAFVIFGDGLGIGTVEELTNK